MKPLNLKEDLEQKYKMGLIDLEEMIQLGQLKEKSNDTMDISFESR